MHRSFSCWWTSIMALRSVCDSWLLQRMRSCGVSSTLQNDFLSTVASCFALKQPGVHVSERNLSMAGRQSFKCFFFMTGRTTWAPGSRPAFSNCETSTYKFEGGRFWHPKLDLRRPVADAICGLRDGARGGNAWHSMSRCQVRECSTKLSPSAYRSSTIAKSTKNMPLVPKKWKRTLPSKEVLNAVYSLRRAKRNPDGIKEVLRKHVARLLKLEMMLVLSELQRLDEWHLSHQVFNMIRKETWYRPNVYLFQTMVQVFGKNKQINEAEKLFEELEDEGLHADDSITRELLRAYVISGMMPEAIKLYKQILQLGKDQAARSILFHGLTSEDKEELAAYERKEGIDWSFVEKNH